MNKKCLFNVRTVAAAVAVPAIALVSQLGLAKVSNASTLKVSCDTQASVPTIIAEFTGAAGKQETKLLTFVPEYFSSQDVATKCENAASILQTMYTSSEMRYLASDIVDERPVICTLARRGIGCDSYNAEVLFFLDRQVNPAMALYNMLGKDFKQAKLPDTRTVSRIYTKLNPPWWRWPF